MEATGILAFCKRFPNEDACLHAVFEAKFGNHQPCPNCGQIGRWGRVKGVKKYYHTCRKQISPLKDTAFYRSNISLSACFYALLLFSNCSSGIRSSFLRKQLGLGTRSSHRLGNRIRLHMSAYDRLPTVGGEAKRVEVDELLIRHVRTPGASELARTIVLGIACEGRVITGLINDRTRATLHEVIARHVRRGSTIITDDWIGYKGVNALGFNHKTVNHSNGFFSKDGISTCNIDSYWATLRRSLRSYHQVSEKNLWLFIAEAEARFNFRDDRGALFEHLVSRWPMINSQRENELMKLYDWR